MNKFEDFVGIFPNAFSQQYCRKLISHFDSIQSTRGEIVGGVVSRQFKEGVGKTVKDSNMYYFEAEEDPTVLQSNSGILSEFNVKMQECYNEYKQKYDIIDTLGQHRISPSVKLQKYEPSQGYHVWHCDNGDSHSSRRMMVVMLYLNTVNGGGETELLYQSQRIVPKEGTLVFFPAGWTHTHRGNPPLNGNKYILNTWLEYT